MYDLDHEKILQSEPKHVISTLIYQCLMLLPSYIYTHTHKATNNYININIKVKNSKPKTRFEFTRAISNVGDLRGFKPPIYD